jgi:hypothetical protein
MTFLNSFLLTLVSDLNTDTIWTIPRFYRSLTYRHLKRDGGLFTLLQIREGPQ